MLVGSPGERISIDITGKHPKSKRGNYYILTVIDHFTKFADGYAIPNHEATTVAKMLINRWFVYFGAPLQILSDRGAELESHLFSELCKSMDIDKIRTTAFKPSTNACVERFHRTLNGMLGKVIHNSQKDWDERLPFVLAAYRATRHESTDFTPNFLTFGRENRAPVDLVLGCSDDDNTQFNSYHECVAGVQEKYRSAFELTSKHLLRCADRRKKYYDIRVKPDVFKPGQWIWYFCLRRLTGRSPKWSKFYTGPWLIVVRMLSAVNAVIQKTKNSKPMVVHVDKIKHCVGQTPNSWIEVEPPVEAEREAECSVIENELVDEVVEASVSSQADIDEPMSERFTR